MKLQRAKDKGVPKRFKPYPEYKDSGIEWLGEIPAHWEVKKLKAASSLQTGITLGKSYDSARRETRPYLRVANVQDGYLDLGEIAEIELPEDEVRRYELRTGDVLMTEGGDFDKLGRG
jgi:type I restriction enzyme S subunit